MDAAKKTAATLLYVEDDDSIRDLVNLMVGRRFPELTILTAKDGRSGLELYKAFASKNPGSPLAAAEMGDAHFAAGLMFQRLGQESLVILGSMTAPVLSDLKKRCIKTNSCEVAAAASNSGRR